MITSSFQTFNKIGLLIALIVLYSLPSLLSEPYFVPRSEVKSEVEDGCTRLAQTISSPSYDDVKACYEGIMYDAERANQIIEVVEEVLLNFYPLLDQAKEEPQAGFSFEPIDLGKELNLLRNKSFNSDFEFMMAIRGLIFQLRDGSTMLGTGCYNAFEFSQSLFLYSVVTPDKQQIMQDFLDPSNNNCEVTEINGQNALEVIKEFANGSIINFRDLGVRFNRALVSIIPVNNTFVDAGGSNLFAHRWDLPESSNINYTVSCPDILNFVREWKINFVGRSKDFNDTKSYFDQNCLPQSKSSKFKKNKRLISKPTFNQIKVSQVELVLSAGDAYFYLVGDIGVAQFTSLYFDNNLLREIQNGFQLLHEKNAKKLVLDLSNNQGGYATAPPIISALLLPSNTSSFFPNDQKITNITEQMIGPGKFFDPNGLLSFPSKENFSSTEDFIGNNSIQRGGTTSRYSSKFNFKINSDALNIINDTKEYPWTKNNTIILTNGYCGGACAIFSLYLAEIGQYPTVSVGGFYNTSLSFSTSPGGESFSYCSSCNNNINGIPNFPVLAELTFNIIETYSVLTDEVLDYSSRHATYRLYYDDESARDPSILWSEAANFLNNES
ncbi:hypothetical protein C2G38_2064906 [Gigaspora rosea]|uniref:Tail specific protease domain-containing protein n=1 Tax=Gigaspora rosea TaxID=44941 RepID=A0A397VV57_9GLOM|nr:hypothetical protein C2G38_2064906 [Gigaspora rosea]